MADLLALLPNVQSNTRSFLRRLSGTHNGAGVRSRSADPMMVRNRLFAEHLSRLRRKIEDMTESLNDPGFEVDEAWLFQFANLHAAYMEKATSKAVVNHEFRSTTDLFQHVLQHPRVLKLMEGCNTTVSVELTAAAGLKSSPVLDTPQKACMAASPASTEIPTSPECSPGLESSPAPCSAEKVPADDDKCQQECPKPDSPSVAAPDNNGGNASANVALSGCGYSTVTSKSDEPAKEHTTKAAPAFLFRGDKLAKEHTTKAAPAFLFRASLPTSSALFPNEGGELMQKFRQRANSTGAVRAPRQSPAPPSEAGELVKKLQQRQSGSSWRGLSPRSQRLAGNRSKNESSDAPVAGSIAERRMLLQGKLASCGFQKNAPIGGA